MHYCVGCFNCWFVTPGECVFNDYGRELAKRICQSDLLIIFSPVTFGSYSSYAKKIIDR
jgi:multimeric flavodoxin WrbA